MGLGTFFRLLVLRYIFWKSFCYIAYKGWETNIVSAVIPDALRIVVWVISDGSYVIYIYNYERLFYVMKSFCFV